MSMLSGLPGSGNSSLSSTGSRHDSIEHLIHHEDENDGTTAMVSRWFPMGSL